LVSLSKMIQDLISFILILLKMSKANELSPLLAGVAGKFFN
jgi:hypothetical protein